MDAPPPTLEELKKKLMARGKSRGSLSYEEISATFEVLEEVTPEQLDEFFEEISAGGIDLVEDQKEEKPEPEAGETPADTISDTLSLDDPVRMYLKEIGRVPLLSMEQEKSLAMRIEAGEMELAKNGTSVRAVVDSGDEAKRQLTEANLRLVVSIAKKNTSDAACCFSISSRKAILGLIRAVEKDSTTAKATSSRPMPLGGSAKRSLARWQTKRGRFVFRSTWSKRSIV